MKVYGVLNPVFNFLQVTEDRKWLEIARVLEIPPIPTNSSFALRTKYNLYLYNYEQIYFLSSDGSRVVNDDRLIPISIPTPIHIPIQRRTREWRKRMGIAAPTHLKRNRSGYIFYFTEQFRRMKPISFLMGQVLARKVGYQWRHLSPSEKSVRVCVYIYLG